LTALSLPGYAREGLGKRSAGEQAGRHVCECTCQAARSRAHSHRRVDLRSISYGPHFVVGKQLDRAGRAEREPTSIGAQDLDTEAHPVPGDAAADSDSSSGTQAWEILIVELEAHRRPRLARVDAGQGFEDMAWLGTHGDPGTPDPFFPSSAHVVGRAG
jgi:hypothetical protein